MAQGEDRWIEVSKSAFSHEAEGLKFLHDLVPNASPYRAWTNFEFMDNHGQWHEIDALILGRRRLHLVELKAYTGVLQGVRDELGDHIARWPLAYPAFAAAGHSPQSAAPGVKNRGRGSQSRVECGA